MAVGTQLELARNGTVSEEMVLCAEAEGVSPEFIRQGVEAGTIVVVRNRTRRGITPLAIGKGLRTKINANVGTSGDHVDIDLEVNKVRTAAAAGADAVMDLSTGGDVRSIRKTIVAASPVAVGTVPIYQAATLMLDQKRAIVEMTADEGCTMCGEFCAIRLGKIPDQGDRHKGTG